MDDSRKAPEMPQWDEIPEPQLVEVPRECPTDAAPVDPETVELVWVIPTRGASLPN